MHSVYFCNACGSKSQDILKAKFCLIFLKRKYIWWHLVNALNILEQKKKGLILKLHWKIKLTFKYFGRLIHICDFHIFVSQLALPSCFILAYIRWIKDRTVVVPPLRILSLLPWITFSPFYYKFRPFQKCPHGNVIACSAGGLRLEIQCSAERSTWLALAIFEVTKSAFHNGYGFPFPCPGYHPEWTWHFSYSDLNTVVVWIPNHMRQVPRSAIPKHWAARVEVWVEQQKQQKMNRHIWWICHSIPLRVGVPWGALIPSTNRKTATKQSQ